jgi:hypothetical protein
MSHMVTTEGLNRHDRAVYNTGDILMTPRLSGGRTAATRLSVNASRGEYLLGAPSGFRTPDPLITGRSFLMVLAYCR